MIKINIKRIKLKSQYFKKNKINKINMKNKLKIIIVDPQFELGLVFPFFIFLIYLFYFILF